MKLLSVPHGLLFLLRDLLCLRPVAAGTCTSSVSGSAASGLGLGNTLSMPYLAYVGQMWDFSASIITWVNSCNRSSLYLSSPPISLPIRYLHLALLHPIYSLSIICALPSTIDSLLSVSIIYLLSIAITYHHLFLFYHLSTYVSSLLSRDMQIYIIDSYVDAVRLSPIASAFQENPASYMHIKPRTFRYARKQGSAWQLIRVQRRTPNPASQVWEHLSVKLNNSSNGL